MSVSEGTPGRSIAFKIKENVIKNSLLALAVTFELSSRYSQELKREIADWDEGRTFSLGVFPDGPAITLKKEGAAVKYLGKGHLNPKLTIYFKNLDAALLPFTGQIGSHMAFVDHRAFLHGNLAEAMEVSRALNIVQAYLLPYPIIMKTYKRAPKLTLNHLSIQGRIMALLVPGIVKSWSK